VGYFWHFSHFKACEELDLKGDFLVVELLVGLRVESGSGGGVSLPPWI
jgi:hypothetical protein